MASLLSARMALVLLTLNAVDASAQPTATAAARGELLLKRQCAVCHALGAGAASPMPEAPGFSEIATRADFDLLRMSLQKGIMSGHPAMPKVVLSPQEVEAILAYLVAARPR